MQRPLEGIRVLDFSRVVAGPHATKIMSDMGADVIKLEPLVGDLTRFAFPKSQGMSTYFTQQNVGKRNISFDLSKPEGRDLAHRLADQCDVVVENFRPDVMPRMGLGFDDLAATNPRLVYLSINGYGSGGSSARRRAYAPVVGAEIGFTQAQGHAYGGTHFVNDPHSHADFYTALNGATAVLAALVSRATTGRGQHVEVTLAQTMMYVWEALHADLNDLDIPENEVRSFGNADYPVFQLADGSHVMVSGHPAAKGAFENYCRSVGRPELIDDARFDTVPKRKAALAALVAELQVGAGRFADIDALEAAMEDHDLAAGTMRTFREAAETEWARETEAIVEVPDRSGGAIKVANVPWKFSETPAAVTGEPRWRGEDNRAVLHEVLGLDDAAIDRLDADGVLSARLPRKK